MRKLTNIIISSVLFMSCHSQVLFSLEPKDLTYEFLESSVYTDHVQHFKKLFSIVKVHSFLEFGVGYGTKYFLDHCDTVTSCEIILPDQTAHWFDHTREVYAQYKNWTPILKYGSPAMQNANVICYQKYQDPEHYQRDYLSELQGICNELFANKTFDVAFVDPGFHMRGDLVNELFHRVPIIAAHDTNIAPKIYGWAKVRTPSNYEKIVCSKGQGVIFWISKDYPELIQALKRTANSR